MQLSPKLERAEGIFYIIESSEKEKALQKINLF